MTDLCRKKNGNSNSNVAKKVANSSKITGRRRKTKNERGPRRTCVRRRRAGRIRPN